MLVKIKLPSEAKILVKKSQMVDFDNYFYSLGSKQTKKINYVNKLKIKPENIYQYSNKLINDEVAIGDVIAIRKTLIKTQKIISDYEGKITSIDHQQGEIIIETKTSDQVKKRCYFKAKIIDTDIKSKIVTIEIESKNEFELTNAKTSYGGEYLIMSLDNGFYSINEAKVSNKIIITDFINPNYAVKLDALGALGIVYTKGQSDLSIDNWQLKNSPDYHKITKIKTNYVIISDFEKKIYFYQ